MYSAIAAVPMTAPMTILSMLKLIFGRNLNDEEKHAEVRHFAPVPSAESIARRIRSSAKTRFAVHVYPP